MPGLFDDLVPNAGPQPARGGAISPEAGAISSVESGGRYDLLGPVTRRGDRAYGRYQVMGENIGPWSAEVFGRPLSAQEFLANPQAQDAVFAHKFGQYQQKYGPEGAARAWFAGEGGMNDMGRRDQLGTTVAEYSRRFQAAMPGAAPQQAPGSDQAMAFSATAQPGNPIAGPAGAPVIRSPGPAAAAHPPASPPAQEATGNIFEDLIPQGPPAPPTQRPPVPILGYPEHYREMRTAAGAQIDRGMQQLGNISADPLNALWGAGNVGFGTIGAVTSPISAAYRNIIGQPVENLTGLPKEYTEFAAQLATPGLGLTRIGATRVPAPPTAIPPGQQTVQAAERLSQTGAPVNVPRFIASDNPVVQRTASTLRNLPGGGEPVLGAAERSVGQLGEKVNEVSAAYGTQAVPAAGASARGAMVNWIGPYTQGRIQNLYDNVRNLVNPAVTTDLAQTRQVAQDIAARRQNAGIQPQSQAAQLVDAAVNRPGGLNYQGIQDLRTYVGQLLERPHVLPADFPEAELRRIYGSLSTDLRTAAQNGGGQPAVNAFERANTYTRLVNARREQLARIVGEDGNAPAERVFDRLSAMASSSSRGDAQLLMQARRSMGAQEWNDVAGAVVARLGRDPAGNFSPQRFVTAWSKISDAGRNILFRSGGRGDLADNLNDIATISQRWQQMQRFANPSGTAQTMAGLGIGAGLFADPLTTIGTVVGARVLASSLSQNATAAPIAQFANRYQLAMRAPSATTFAGLSTAARNLSNTINSELGLSTKADDFLRAIQGTMPARSEDEQPQPGRIGHH